MNSLVWNSLKTDKSLNDGDVYSLVEVNPSLNELSDIAYNLCSLGHGNKISYSKKIFIPLTKLCRDVCHYCTFAQSPRKSVSPYMHKEEVISLARKGQEAGCKEALFTLGDKPEYRYSSAKQFLKKAGHDSTISYLHEIAGEVAKQTGLLPHLNPGTMTYEELASLREVSASMGIMLENVSERLCKKGQPHYGSPDKNPLMRLKTISDAGELSIPLSTGILIGIGETRLERIQSLLAIRKLHQKYGHIQEIILQNFQAKPETKMSNHADPKKEELLWTIAFARIIFGSNMNIQVPPNLNTYYMKDVIKAGINDWGGISPLTIDHVNPEAPWPSIEKLAEETSDGGKILIERLTVYPAFIKRSENWLDEGMMKNVLKLSDSSNFARQDSWTAGRSVDVPCEYNMGNKNYSSKISKSLIVKIIDCAVSGKELNESDITVLFGAKGLEFDLVCEAADSLRKEMVGDKITYVVNRNINYTNICQYHCNFCAFSKGARIGENKDNAYVMSLDEISRRASEAWELGASEVCLQGGIHPSYTGDTYLDIVETISSEIPDIHIHAFSPLEIFHGANTIGMPLEEYLLRLKEAGLSSLPGTAAEILDDNIRQIICPDKISSNQWCDIVTTAHKIGMKSTATIMFGHVEEIRHWSRHLIKIRTIQKETGGFTEFVPLPFVHMEAPSYLKGIARPGPTYAESILMHAVSRLVLNPVIKNIQTSWVKMGESGAMHCLNAGANDLGGSLMNESITRAAGAKHGQELTEEKIKNIIGSLGRINMRRTTTYKDARVFQ